MRRVVVVAVLMGSLVAGPAWGTQHYTVVASNPKTGSTIEIPNGDALLLKLTACESCGYRWKVTQKPNAQVVAFNKQLSSISQCKSPCTGGNATERFQFSSKSVGTATVKLGYFGPANSKPSKTLKLALDVIS